MSKKPDLSGLTKKERKELLKNYRKKESEKVNIKGKIFKLTIAIVVIAVVGGIGYLLATSDSSDRVVLGEEIANQGASHINTGSQHEPYNSNPPTSGPHYSSPAECRVYDEEVIDEAVIHSLEHGAVWVSYKDKSNTALVNQLKGVVEKNSGKVILSPRAANDSEIALVSWTRILKLADFDGDQIAEFIKVNRSNSPEPLAPC